MFSFKNTLEKKMLEKNFSMQGLSVAAGLEKGAVKSILYGRSVNPRIDTVGKLAQGLECSPLDLLPSEWKKPETRELDEKIMRSALKGAMRIFLERKEDAGLDLEWYYDMVVAAYKKFHKTPDLANDNMVYIWIDGKIDDKKLKKDF